MAKKVSLKNRIVGAGKMFVAVFKNDDKLIEDAMRTAGFDENEIKETLKNVKTSR